MVNALKTKVVVFGEGDYTSSSYLNVKISGDAVEVTDEYKYLGFILNQRMSENSDLERITKSFNMSCGMFFREFGTIDLSTKWKLLNMLCFSFYVLNTLCSKKGSSSKIRELSVAYHYTMKRILGFLKYYSNHYLLCHAKYSNF